MGHILNSVFSQLTMEFLEVLDCFSNAQKKMAADQLMIKYFT